MKTLVVQVVPGPSPDADVEAIVLSLERLARNPSLAQHVEVTRGVDEGNFVNVTFKTSDPGELWRAIQAALDLREASPAANMITAVCEGDHGWDDYLLLHHRDPEQQVDRLRVQ